MILVDGGGDRAHCFIRIGTAAVRPSLGAVAIDGGDDLVLVGDVDSVVRSEDGRYLHASGVEFPFQFAGGVEGVDKTVFARGVERAVIAEGESGADRSGCCESPFLLNRRRLSVDGFSGGAESRGNQMGRYGAGDDAANNYGCDDNEHPTNRAAENSIRPLAHWAL